MWEGEGLRGLGIRAAMTWLNSMSCHVILCHDMTICHNMTFISEVLIYILRQLLVCLGKSCKCTLFKNIDIDLAYVISWIRIEGAGKLLEMLVWWALACQKL